MQFYDPRIKDSRFIPFIPLPVAAAFAIVVNSLGAIYGKDPTQSFEEAEQALKQLDNFFPKEKLCAEVHDLFSPYVLYKINAHIGSVDIHFSHSSIPAMCTNARKAEAVLS